MIVKNDLNVCVSCDLSCAVGYCTYGNNPAKCTKCASSSKFLNSSNTCVLATACETGYRGY